MAVPMAVASVSTLSSPSNASRRANSGQLKNVFNQDWRRVICLRPSSRASTCIACRLRALLASALLASALPRASVTPDLGVQRVELHLDPPGLQVAVDLAGTHPLLVVQTHDLRTQLGMNPVAVALAGSGRHPQQVLQVTHGVPALAQTLRVPPDGSALG